MVSKNNVTYVPNGHHRYQSQPSVRFRAILPRMSIKIAPPSPSLSPGAAHACPMPARPTLQHGDAIGRLLMHCMAMLWNGGAAVCRRLCRHLSLFRMSTSVRDDRLHGVGDGPPGAQPGARPRRRKGLPSPSAPPHRAERRAASLELAVSSPRRAEAGSAFRPMRIGSMHILA